MLNSNHKRCDFCEKTSHVESQCFLNLNNSNNKLSMTTLERMMIGAERKNPTDTSKKNPKRTRKFEVVGAEIEKTTVSPPKDLRCYADSDETTHAFRCIYEFVPA